jgi:virginiamycin B lyase
MLLAAALTVQAQGAGQGQGRGVGRGGGRGQVQLPDGPGKQAVEGLCVTCHQLNTLAGSPGYTQQGWRDLIGTMVKVPDAQLNEVTQYLAANFPEKPVRRPTLVPGPVRVTFQEWMVPTLGQRSRDPIQLPDGTIWWTGQFASLIGRLNPTTGEMKEYPLAPEVRPHSIVADRDGRVWYMGNGNATIGRLDPATGQVTEYKMPDAAARDPHTGVFDPQGTLWFTLQQSNMVGRLVPSTGALTFARMPTPGARPYGIVVTASGIPWVAYAGSNKLASLDPATMAVREHPLPNAASRVRRLGVLSDGSIVYGDSGQGVVGRLHPATGAVKEWPSPSGRQSSPYALAVVDDVVWYNESNQRPDTLVRFDPKTERFQSWAIPSGVGIIRHMTVSPRGDLVIHQSSSNRIGLVRIEK